jgi:hypothetical protein
MKPRAQRDQVRNSGSKVSDSPAGDHQPSHQRDIDARPTGLPTSDRHATETAHHWEHETKPTGETASEG